MRLYRPTVIRFLLSFLAAFLTLLFFSGSTSPLYNISFSDGLVFQYVAEGLNHGQIPYIDIFDHKGPFLYFINYIGLSLGGRIGLFCLQCINLTLTLFLCVRFCAQLHLQHKMIFILIFSMSLLIRFMSEGDMTEEWSLLFLTIPMLFLLRYLLCPSYTLSCRHLFVLGFCAGLISLLRLNNVAPLLGLFCWWLLLEVRQKHYGYLSKVIPCALIAFFLPISIACYWFYSRAGNQGLYELFYANILFNLEYASRPWPNSLPLWKQIGVTFIHNAVFLFALFRCLKDASYRNICIGLIFAILFSLLTMGRSWFPHYQMILLPTFIIVIAVLSHFRMKICLLLVLSSCLYWNRSSVALAYQRYFEDNRVNDLFQREFDDLVDIIPRAEKTQIWNLNCIENFDAFLHSDIYPQSRFCCTWHRSYSKRFVEEEIDGFWRTAPLWVFVDESYLGENHADSVFLVRNYHKLGQTNSPKRNPISLYRRDY